MINRLNPIGNRLSEAVIHNGIVYSAGQVALNAEGGSIEDQTKDVLATLDRILEEASSDKSRMLSASIWLTHIEDVKAFNEIWDEWIPEGCAPARACVEAKLVSPDLTVEVSVIAAQKD